MEGSSIPNKRKSDSEPNDGQPGSPKRPNNHLLARMEPTPTNANRTKRDLRVNKKMPVEKKRTQSTTKYQQSEGKGVCQRTSHRGTSENRGVTGEVYVNELKAEALRAANCDSTLDANGVFDAFIDPNDKQAVLKIETITDKVMVKFKAYVDEAKQRQQVQQTKKKQTGLQTRKAKRREEAAAAAVAAVAAEAAFLGLTQETEKYRDELDMYPGIRAILAKASDWIYEVSLQEEGLKRNARLIYPYQMSNVEAKENNNSKDRMDVGYFIVPDKEPATQYRPDYLNILGIVEAKVSRKDTYEALAQLYRYLLTIYDKQQHRRFTTGITLCDRDARACFFTHDHIYVSPIMNIAEEGGQRQFMRLLVSWAMCPSNLLGYDSSMKYDFTYDAWEITAFNNDRKTDSKYYSREMVVSADHMFGRHTRCFLSMDSAAYAKFEQEYRDVDIDKLDDTAKEERICRIWPKYCKFIVKDSWARHNDGRQICKEIELMNHMRQWMAGHPEDKRMWPEMVHGGPVRLGDDEVDDEVDDTRTAFSVAAGGKLDNVTFRRHQRIVMTPVGRPIKEVRSVDESIIVVSGLIKALHKLYYDLGIIHRDISMNNVLFTRNEHGYPEVCLIDYDYADKVDRDASSGDAVSGDGVPAPTPDSGAASGDGDSEGVRTGTPPYMSICNLLKTKKVPRTSLDDLESTMYLISVLGTDGVNWEDENKIEVRHDLSIRKWRVGSYEAIAQEKMNHVASKITFMQNITKNFYRDKEYKELAKLVHRLRTAIFNNPNLSSKSRGTADITTEDLDFSSDTEDSPTPRRMFKDNHVDDSVTDPFLRRTKCIDVIFADALQIAEQAEQAAISRVNSRAGSS